MSWYLQARSPGNQWVMGVLRGPLPSQSPRTPRVVLASSPGPCSPPAATPLHWCLKSQSTHGHGVWSWRGFPWRGRAGEDRCGEEAGALPAAVGHPEPQGTLPCCRRQRRLFRPQRLGRSVGTWPRVRARSAEPSRPSPPAQPRPRAARLGFVALNGCRATAVTGPSLQKETRLRSPRNSGCSGVLRFTACLCPGLTGRAGGHSQTRSLWGGPQHTRRPGYLGNEKLFCRE